MKQTLSLKIGQQLTMTPQMQHNIRMLQMSSLELSVEVQDAIETNPMLELEEDTPEAPDPEGESIEDVEAQDPAAADAEPESGFEDAQDYPELSGSNDEVVESEATEDPNADIPEELPVDTTWDDVYEPPPAPAASAASSDNSDSDFNFEERNPASESLTDHLHWQLNMTNASDRDQVIALAIIDEIDADGMLGVTLEQIAETMDADLEIEVDEIEAVLKLIQQFDPTGVGARNLQECLVLQLRTLPDDVDYREAALQMVSEHFDLLASRDHSALMRRLNLSDDEFREVVTVIQSLNPRPGSSVGPDDTEYVDPDVIVRKDSGRWVVELNPKTAPRVRINPTYEQAAQSNARNADATFLRENLRDAKTFLLGIQHRNDTLLQTATKIVEHQRGFLEYGEEAMKPLILAEIADAIGHHESTISRITTRKYMRTPRGTYELKYFFSSHLSTTNGGEVSSTAIRALIKKLTSEENPRKPLSDNKIANLLADQEIKVARRTVAKYRESMAIPPSNERKRLA